MSENTTQSGYKEKEDLVVTRIIDAPIELVWKSWTDPEHVMKWWGPKYYTSPSCKIDLREGGKYVFCMRAPQEQGGQDSYTAGIFKKILPMELLEFTQGMADQDGFDARIGATEHIHIGVADKQGSVFGQSLDKFLIAPETAPLNRWVNPHGVVDAMIVQGQDDASMREAMEAARATMRARRHLHPSQADNFELETSDNALEFWNKLKGYLVMAGIALPTVGLVVGAIVIMNIMLVAVAERTREIGIRKSLGARRKDILNQFLVEAATLSTLGAAVGVALGIGFAKLIAAVSPLPAAVEIWSIFLGVGVGAGVGMIAGIYPASRAALLDPITAMRAET